MTNYLMALTEKIEGLNSPLSEPWLGGDLPNLWPSLSHPKPIREGPFLMMRLIGWLRRHHPQALPIQGVEGQRRPPGFRQRSSVAGAPGGDSMPAPHMHGDFSGLIGWNHQLGRSITDKLRICLVCSCIWIRGSKVFDLQELSFGIKSQPMSRSQT
jgi:hypothetical protein